ncbi:4571_t:CDS:1, partial [Ambispora leptoticha]
IQTLKRFLEIWKNNNIANNVIEISNQNISIIDENGLKTTSSINEIIQYSTENPVKNNNLNEEFINNEAWDEILQTLEPIDIPNIPENIEVIENTSVGNINHQSPKRKDNNFIIDQIKQDLEHEIEDRVQLNSPYQGSDDIQIYNKIIMKVQTFGKKKNKHIQRLEALYYLEQLKESNRNNKQITRYIRNQLTHSLGETKSCRL